MKSPHNFAALVLSWFSYMMVGPFLISARKSLLVLLGIGIFGALLCATYYHLRSETGGKPHA